ncbi:MAG: hypothetical protein PHX82_16080 [Paracoccaceae bacterium]|nr:hypothetical protein [Paracoccaceae bacterium]
MIAAKKRRKPQYNREVAAKAANDIRAFRFATIYDAVDQYFPELTGTLGRNYNPADRRKDFATYIFEDLKAGPKSLHVFWALADFSKRQNRQRKHQRNAELISRFMSK